MGTITITSLLPSTIITADPILLLQLLLPILLLPSNANIFIKVKTFL
jgi:hypothetical protein